MSLRKKLIRIAYQNPSLRSDILPLITKSSKKVQVVNKETGNTVSVNEETLKDPKKKKLYAPVEESSKKKKTERTDEERVMNIVENQAKKEGWTKAELDKMKKRLKGMSKSTMRGYLAAMSGYETDEDPSYEPEFATEKDKEDKAKADKEESAKKLRNKQKNVSNKILTDKKIDEIAESLKDKRLEKKNIHGFKPKIDWRGVRRDLQDVAGSDDTYGAIEKYLEENKDYSPEYLKPFEDLKKEIEELAEKEPDVKRTKSKEQKYKDAIKNSDMSAEDKKKAIERLKDPKFDLDGALAGMSDDEEEGSKDASLRSSLIRLAYEQPQLRDDLLPLITKSAEKVQVVNRETGNTVSVNEETLKDPEKKKLYAPLKEKSEKKDDDGGSSNSAPKSNIFKEQSKRKSDLEKWVEENDVDGILSELDFDDIMDLENEWEDALYNLEEEDEDKAEEFEKKMKEFFKGEEKQMEIRDKIETMSDDLENDDSSKGKFVLKMLDGMGADPEDQLQNLKDVLFYVKGGYEQRKRRKDKLNKDTIDQIKTFEREEVSKSMGKFHLSKEDQQKALEEYIGEIEKVMGGDTKSKGKKASLRSSLIRLAYEQPQLREDLLPLITKSKI